MNRQMIIGNLGADPETRTTNSGTTVGTLRVAVNERVKKGESWEDHTEWFLVTVFGKLAENCAKYIKKGSKVYVEGKTRNEKYTKDGVEKYITKVLADNVTFLDSKSGPGSGMKPAADDDIPF